MRMYAVITPPLAVLQHARRAVDEAALQAPGVPWTEPALWGCRIASFGNLGLEELTIVKNTLSEIGTYCPPLTLWLAAATALPSDTRAEGVSFQVAGDVANLVSLATTLPPMVQRHGLFLDRRNFKPVVTVAQGAREPFDASPVLSALCGYSGPQWTATDMRLVRLIPHSADGSGMGDHEDVTRYAFSAPIEANQYAAAHPESNAATAG